jgi:hypothetical protein
MKKIMTIIIRFSYEHLRNETHVAFHTMFSSLVARFNPETPGIDPLYEEEVAAASQHQFLYFENSFYLCLRFRSLTFCALLFSF